MVDVCIQNDNVILSAAKDLFYSGIFRYAPNDKLNHT